MTANRDLKRRVRDRQAHTGESYVTALRHVRAQGGGGDAEGDEGGAGGGDGEGGEGDGAGGGGLRGRIPLLEFTELTELGARIGLKCRISAVPALLQHLDAEETLRRFRDALLVTCGDSELSLMRAVALRGEHPVRSLGAEALGESRRFLERVRAGLAGVSELGRMLALHGAPPGEPAEALGHDGVGRGAPGDPPAVASPRYRGGGAASLVGPLVLFSIWYLPVHLAGARPPMLLLTAVDAMVVDPVIDSLRELVGDSLFLMPRPRP